MSAQGPRTATPGSARPTLREQGVTVGRLPTGPLNSITDIRGVRVGHVTRVEDDVPVPGCSEKGEGRRLTVGEVLRALDTGESLVEIEDDQSTVRIWVE